MLWANIGDELKDTLKIAAIHAKKTLSEYVVGAVNFRLQHEEEVKNFLDSVPKMEYSHLENELSELLSDGDTQPPASERE